MKIKIVKLTDITEAGISIEKLYVTFSDIVITKEKIKDIISRVGKQLGKSSTFEIIESNLFDEMLEKELNLYRIEPSYQILTIYDKVCVKKNKGENMALYWCVLCCEVIKGDNSDLEAHYNKNKDHQFVSFEEYLKDYVVILER